MFQKQYIQRHQIRELVNIVVVKDIESVFSLVMIRNMETDSGEPTQEQKLATEVERLKEASEKVKLENPQK